LNLEYLANYRVKERVRLQHQQITLLERQLQTAKVELQDRLELSTLQDEELVVLQAKIEELSTERQHTEEKLARIREVVRPTPDIEVRTRAGASELKRTRICEERNDVGSSARVFKRSKGRFWKNGETRPVTEEIRGNEVMPEDED